jgi:twitching motility protein PilT
MGNESNSNFDPKDPSTWGSSESIDVGDQNGSDDTGSLVDRIIRVLCSDIPFSDIFIHEDSPMMLKQPKKLLPVSKEVVTQEDLKELFNILEPDWEQKIGQRAFDKAIDLNSCRIRANCFTYGGRRKFGCVIRRFPSNPMSLAEIGLRPNSQAFVQFNKGLVLIIGDTGQGKSTTISSMLDQINATRAAHILTFEDPIEQVLTPKSSLITQREVGIEGDVESFYLGALDALRERPDVVLIGEIREPEVAREAVQLAESGPLVFATLHARSTDFAIAKMHRLLGATDSASQALAQSLRGILCQSLLPSQSGDRYHLATECLTVTPDAAALIETRNYAGLRTFLNSGADSQSHSMNSELMSLYSSGKITFDDAQRATTDRPQFEKIFSKRVS